MPRSVVMCVEFVVTTSGSSLVASWVSGIVRSASQELWSFEPLSSLQLTCIDDTSSKVCRVVGGVNKPPLVGTQHVPDDLYPVGYIAVGPPAFVLDVS